MGTESRITSWRPRRHFLRFSLRGLMVLVTLTSIWLAWYVSQVRRQQASVAAVRRLGGWVYYDFHGFSPSRGVLDPQAESPVPKWLLSSLGVDFFHRVVAVNMVYEEGPLDPSCNPQLHTGEVLRHLDGLPHLRGLYLSGQQATDEGMRHVAKAKNLEVVFMWDAARMTDAGIAHLAGLEKLQHIQCSAAQLTDESLRILGQLPEMEDLSLQDNQFSDEGLYHLRDAKQLRHLAVGCPRKRVTGPNDRDPGRTAGSGIRPEKQSITDHGLVHLRNLRNLTLLDLQGSRVTDQGLEHLTRLPNLGDLWIGNTLVRDTRSFQTAMPKCRISR